MRRTDRFVSLTKGLGAIALVLVLMGLVLSPGYAAGSDPRTLFRTLDGLVLEGMEVWGVPGVAYAVVSGDQVVHRACFGVRKIGESGPELRVDRDTVFQIGSTTKAFTSALMAMLVDEGRLSWDDRVEDHLPGFRLSDSFAQKDFRLFDLMAQHSGLAPYSLDGMPILGYGREAVMKALKFVEPQTPFRSAFAYQNGLFLPAAAIIEKETGRSWEENLKERIFDPLGMESAGATFGEFTAQPGRTAWLHRVRDGKTEVLPMDWPWQDWVYTVGPAGSIHADIDDFARWLRFQIGRGHFEGQQLLSEEEMAFLIKPQTLIGFGGGDGAVYCEGWVRESYRGIDLVWHNGTTLGAHSIIAFLPDEGAGVVVLTNQAGNSLPEAMMRTFVDLWPDRRGKDWVAELSASGGEEPVDPPEKVRLSRDRAAYAGIYENPVYGRLSIVEENGSLVARLLSPKPQVLKLEVWDGDIFAAEWDVFPDPRVFVTFHSDSKGSIEAVTVEPLDDELGLGRFERTE